MKKEKMPENAVTFCVLVVQPYRYHGNGQWCELYVSLIERVAGKFMFIALDIA